MRLLLIQDRAVDGGYPVDSDLHQMTDDGCPLVPDPARWADDAWRDRHGELDTVDGRPAPAGLARLPAQGAVTRRSRLLRCTDCGRTEAYSPERLLVLFGSSGWPECCGRVMDYFALPPPGPAASASLPRTSERSRYLGLAGGDGMERWGLFLGFALGAVALAVGGASLYWLEGPALVAGAALFGLCFWAAVMSVRAFDRSSR